jgi:hypothetical protein
VHEQAIEVPPKGVDLTIKVSSTAKEPTEQ